MTEASIPLRPAVREIMKLAKDRPWTVSALMMQLQRNVPDVQPVDVEAALVWNYGRGFVTSTFNHELEVDTYKITERGLAA